MAQTGDSWIMMCAVCGQWRRWRGAPAPEPPPFADELIYYLKVFIK